MLFNWTFRLWSYFTDTEFLRLFNNGFLGNRSWLWRDQHICSCRYQSSTYASEFDDKATVKPFAYPLHENFEQLQQHKKSIKKTFLFDVWIVRYSHDGLKWIASRMVDDDDVLIMSIKNRILSVLGRQGKSFLPSRCITFREITWDDDLDWSAEKIGKLLRKLGLTEMFTRKLAIDFLQSNPFSFFRKSLALQANF